MPKTPAPKTPAAPKNQNRSAKLAKFEFRRAALKILRRTSAARHAPAVLALDALLRRLRARRILLFIPLKDEPNVLQLCRLRSRKKREFFSTFMQNQSLKIVKLARPFSRAAFGVRESSARCEHGWHARGSAAGLRGLDVAVVPCVGADGALGRIGRGMGFYDRLFERLGAANAGAAAARLGIKKVQNSNLGGFCAASLGDKSSANARANPQPSAANSNLTNDYQNALNDGKNSNFNAKNSPNLTKKIAQPAQNLSQNATKTAQTAPQNVAKNAQTATKTAPQAATTAPNSNLPRTSPHAKRPPRPLPPHSRLIVIFIGGVKTRAVLTEPHDIVADFYVTPNKIFQRIKNVGNSSSCSRLIARGRGAWRRYR